VDGVFTISYVQFFWDFRFNIMKVSFGLATLTTTTTLWSISQLQLVDGATEPSWEEAPLMDAPPLGVESNHCYGSTIRGLSFLSGGILRIPEFDSCGETCTTREEFSDLYATYSTEDGYTE
jgi:hypothetical protein